jgi:hypothetical protein
MRGASRLAVAALFAATGGLACSMGPSYPQLMATLGPPAAGQGRLFVYLTDATQAPAFWPIIAIDGQTMGEVRTGSFFYVDRPAGIHSVGVGMTTANAAFGTQGQTPPVQVELLPGTSSYVQVFVIVMPGTVQVQLTPESTQDGQRDLTPLHYLAPTPPPPP